MQCNFVTEERHVEITTTIASRHQELASILGITKDTSFEGPIKLMENVEEIGKKTVVCNYRYIYYSLFYFKSLKIL